jgi:perosamine synthetase
MRPVTADSLPTQRIPLAEPCLDEADAQAVADCVRSGWISTYSPLVNRFEQAMAQFLGVPDAVALNCGTTALHIALQLAGVKAGDKVAVPALTFVATVNPVRYLGAIPVFVDVNPCTMGMCPDQLAHILAANPDVVAVVVTHLYGHGADVEALKAVAGSLPLIEDAAEALGSGIGRGGQYAGTLADYGCYSFNGNKTMTTGSGGLLVAKEADLLATARYLSAQAKAPDTPEFIHTAVGYNCRMNGIQAALGLSQLQKLPGFLRQKRQLANRYALALPGHTPALQHMGQQIPWLSTGLFANRQSLAMALAKQQILTRPFFKPLPLLSPYQPFAQGNYPMAEAFWQQGLCLPSSPSLTDAQQKYVIGVIKAHL